MISTFKITMTNENISHLTKYYFILYLKLVNNSKRPHIKFVNNMINIIFFKFIFIYYIFIRSIKGFYRFYLIK